MRANLDSFVAIVLARTDWTDLRHQVTALTMAVHTNEIDADELKKLLTWLEALEDARVHDRDAEQRALVASVLEDDDHEI
jgi:hypothetical protein